MANVLRQQRESCAKPMGQGELSAGPGQQAHSPFLGVPSTLCSRLVHNTVLVEASPELTPPPCPIECLSLGFFFVLGAPNI